MEIYGNLWRYMKMEICMVDWNSSLEYLEISSISGFLTTVEFHPIPQSLMAMLAMCMAIFSCIHKMLRTSNTSNHSVSFIQCCKMAVKMTAKHFAKKNTHRLSSVQNLVIPFWWVDRGSQTAS
jgi:hypothetical protein